MSEENQDTHQGEDTGLSALEEMRYKTLLLKADRIIERAVTFLNFDKVEKDNDKPENQKLSEEEMQHNVALGIRAIAELEDDEMAATLVKDRAWREYLFPALYFLHHKQPPPDIHQAWVNLQAHAMVIAVEDLARHILTGENPNRDLKFDKQSMRTIDRRVTDQFAESQKPAPEGTTAEIAEAYGVSKKQVRKMKQEGRLHELTGSS